MKPTTTAEDYRTMLIRKRKYVMIFACTIIVAYTVMSMSNIGGPMSRPAYKESEKWPHRSLTSPTVSESITSSQTTGFRAVDTTPRTEEEQTTAPLTNHFEWLAKTSKMDVLPEDRLRCKALDMGCFVPYDNPHSSYVRMKMSEGDNSLFKERCLNQCFKQNYRLAGFNAEIRACLCSKTLNGFISYNKKGKWASESMDLANKCRAKNSIRVYSKIRNCEEGAREHLESDKLGCIETPKEIQAMIALSGQQATVAQCIFNCELRQFTYAVPVLEHDACLCSHSYTLFGTAENMREMLRHCDDKDGERVPVYRTVVDDEHCTPLRFLQPKQAPPILLASYYGSGNTWIRHLIEVSTGIYTGSVYRDWKLYEGGMLGEPNAYNSGRTVAVKDHLFKLNINSGFKLAILLLRNPYDATLAEWSRRGTKNHTGVVDPKAFQTAAFKKYARNRPEYWFGIAESVFKFFSKVLVIYYEDLVTDAVSQMRRVAKFLPPGLAASEGEKLERRLMCLNLDLVGNFKRPPRNLGFDPFDAFIRNKFDKTIRNLDDLLIENHQPPLPDSYFLPS